MKIRLGISTCPNDTFAFHAILERRIDLDGFTFEVELLDVEELNRGLFDGRYDVAKASFHAALHLADRYALLPAGSAIGFGVGPLLLAREGAPSVPARTSRILCPGAWTTAHLLMQVLYPDAPPAQHVVFSEIMPSLERGDADFGVVIHEGRFTYREHGLRLVSDLGASWETVSHGPVPLGGILVRNDLPVTQRIALGQCIARSLKYAKAHRNEAYETMRAHAQELDPEVIWAHVDLYVTDDTQELGDAARSSLRALDRRARATGKLASSMPALEFVPAH